jgi:very-short-patch-repair endonuclease
MTPPEVALWARLRARQPGYPAIRRQHPVGPYIIDFYCSATRTAIEVDGMVHLHGDNPGRDERRDAYLESQGIRVIRYAASEVLRDVDEAAMSIIQAVAAPPQSSAAPLTAPPLLGGAEATFSSPACGGGGPPQAGRRGR